MGARLKIREATAGDVAALARIYGHHVKHGTGTFELEAPGEEEMERRRAAIQKAGLPYLVAERGGVVLGFAYAGPYRMRPAYSYTVENSIYLEEEARGKGVGSALMAELIERCERAGKRQMVAVVGDSANAASVGLHKKFGFRKVGVLRSVGRKFGRWLDTVILQRELSGGGTIIHAGGKGGQLAPKKRQG